MKLFRFLIFIHLYFIAYPLCGQVFLKGKILNEKMEGLALANIRIEGKQTGTRTNIDGEFKLLLFSGKNDIVISMLGYKTLRTVLIAQDTDLMSNFILEPLDKEIGEVNISAKRTDIARFAIQKIIENKEHWNNKNTAYEFDAYIKCNQEFQQKKITTDSVVKENNANNFVEIILHVEKSAENKIKEHIEAINSKVKVRDKYYYTTFTDGDFNFYENTLLIPSLGNTTFLSPFSYSGMMVYKYKLLETIMLQKDTIYHISFSPRAMANALLSGEVYVTRNKWAIDSIFVVFPNAHTPEYKKLDIRIQYVRFDNRFLFPKEYKINYISVQDKDLKGTTLVAFKNYKLTIDSNQNERKKFNPELSRVADSAYLKSDSFWNSKRDITLTTDEIKYLHKRDSVYNYTHSEKYLDSIDKDNRKFTLYKIGWDGYTITNWKHKERLSIEPLPALLDFLSIGGIRIRPIVSYFRETQTKRNYYIYSGVSYGTVNKDFRGNINFRYHFNPVKNQNLYVNIYRNVSNMFFGDAIVNLLQRRNYFLKSGVSIGANSEIINGLYVRSILEIGRRSSLSNLILNSKIDSLFPSSNNKPIDFEAYNAAFAIFTLSYTLHQMYIREPNQKIILGSLYPTISVQIRNGIPKFLNSTIDYTTLELSVSQGINLGTFGNSEYTIRYGDFLNAKKVEPVDFKYIARGNPSIFFNPLNSFQAMDSTFSIYNNYIEAHYLHHFNGSLINKIPYMRFLKIDEIAGLSAISVPERNLKYVEVFAGIQKPFNFLKTKLKFGVYIVSSWANNFQSPLQIKFGIQGYDKENNKWDF